jgi:hypothetical protein
VELVAMLMIGEGGTHDHSPEKALSSVGVWPRRLQEGHRSVRRTPHSHQARGRG